MRVLFMGTPDFAVPCLENLINSNFDIVGVFTQPDKPRGRKQEMAEPDVKVCALKHGLDVYQPKTLKTQDSYELIKSLEPDVIVVVAYGKILPKNILGFPKLGCINVHASLLPKYRGSAPIQWSVINGEKETGVTIMQMDEGIDTGDILVVEKMPVGLFDTSESMFEKLSALGAKTLVNALKRLEKGELEAVKQDDSLATYSPMIKKSMGKIDWKKSSEDVHNLIRGMYSWPIAYTYYKGKMLKIYSSKPSCLSGSPGEVLSLSPFVIACADKSVEITQLQLEGKKRMDSSAFLMGQNIKKGYIFEE